MKPPQTGPSEPVHSQLPSTESLRSEPSRWRRLAARLTLELLVVFIGVYAASMLAQRHADRAELARADALRASLAAELDYIRAKGRELELGQIEAYATAIEQGRQPALQPFASRIPFTPDVWEAALASGGVQLLEPELLIDLSQFYGSMRSFMAELDAHRAYIREILLPNLDQPPSEFYDDAGAIRPKYRWYLEHLYWMPREVTRLTELAEQLHERLSPG